MIVTVTLNAAIDRTLTVPNFQLGQRHRASQGLTLAGGKGINVARALKRLDVPVVATGLAGGRTGTRIVEELTSEAILNDFVRIADESRTSTAVVDPTAGDVHGDQRVGAAREPEELAILLDKINYLARGADMVVFAGTLPRGVGDVSTPRRSAISTGATCRPSSTRKGRRCGSASRPRPSSSRRTSVRPRVSSARSSGTTRTTRWRSTGSPTWARATCSSPRRPEASGSSASSGSERCFRADAPLVEPVSAVGSGDVLLAAFLAARVAEKPLEDSLKSAVAAGAASTLEVGAGRFEPEGGLAAAELGRRPGARAGRGLMSWRGASVTRWESS